MKERRFPWRRLVAVLLVAAAVPGVWFLLDLPPPLFIARYGLPPAGGPTGDSRLIANTTFIELSPGYFLHEGPDGERRWVEVDHPIWVATTELTNDAYCVFDPDHAKGANPLMPASRLSYEDALAFCRWVSAQTDFRVRPPTCEEWEYACRAGTTTAWYTGDDPEDVGNAAWLVGNSGNTTFVVEMRLANRWDLVDFHGNVAEWCADAVADPERGLLRAVRGGHYRSSANECRSSVRTLVPETTRSPKIGFRPVAVRKR